MYPDERDRSLVLGVLSLTSCFPGVALDCMVWLVVLFKCRKHFRSFDETREFFANLNLSFIAHSDENAHD